MKEITFENITTEQGAKLSELKSEGKDNEKL